MPKAAKKAKDPNAPKRPLSAYFIWLKENREAIKKPGMSVTDVSKAAGVQWNALKDKTRWEKLAQEDKARYERDMAKYQRGH